VFETWDSTTSSILGFWFWPGYRGFANDS